MFVVVWWFGVCCFLIVDHCWLLFVFWLFVGRFVVCCLLFVVCRLSCVMRCALINVRCPLCVS